jgi:hypothetical protein
VDGLLHAFSESRSDLSAKNPDEPGSYYGSRGRLRLPPDEAHQPLLGTIAVRELFKRPEICPPGRRALALTVHLS